MKGGRGASSAGLMAAQKEERSAGGQQQQCEETDGQIQARALKQVMMRLGGKDDEGPPLTTRAVKELERAKKAVVHRHTLIKISLPGSDQVCLQAYFHPRDTVHDIAHWLRSECFAGEGEGEEGGPQQHEFDLYTSPPRRSLFSAKQGPGGESGGEKEGESTLQDLSLVPAAVVYLAWQGASGGGQREESGDHSFLSPALQNKLCEDRSNAELSFQSFPSGQRLVPKSETEEVAAGKQAGGSRGKVLGSGSGSGGDSSEGKKSGKPKWFKL